ncbi:hypothetical protein [Mycobacterium leprae]|uniref:hypothetical protein n=1 Tax=Mycobacterium leprae TaxID=1769 RepID=UPI000307A51D|nr:hypothetical protein [Mycobacterium leprae]
MTDFVLAGGDNSSAPLALFIAEGIMVYLSKDERLALLRYITERFPVSRLCGSTYSTLSEFAPR